jgi:predicted RNA-binding protein with RPS1 domain
VQATVTKLTKFGAFARLVDAPEIEGLIHISELADYRVSHPREVVLVGDVLTLRIVKIDADQRRLGLSLRQVDSAKYMDQDWQAIADEFEQQDDTADDTPVAAELEDDAADDAPVIAEPEDDTADDTPVAAELEDDTADDTPVAAELEDDAVDDALVAAELEDDTADDAPVAAEPEDDAADDALVAAEPESYEPANDSEDDDSPMEDDKLKSAEDET